MERSPTKSLGSFGRAGQHDKFEHEYRFTQSIIDQLSVSMLQDHSIFSINDDLAWFRMLEQLQEYSYPVIRKHSTAR